MTEISVDEAYAIVRQLREELDQARSRLTQCEQIRDYWLRAIDGQEGIRRAELAEAAGLTVSRLQQIVGGHGPVRELIPEGVEVDDALRAALLDVLEDLKEDVSEDDYRIDVTP